jgi:N-ethylmaleimide reductase
MNKLLNSFMLGDIELANRVVMAPMTRSRAGLGDTPTSLNATYYAQRASAGLIITEATNITDNSCAFEKSPGIYTAAQVDGWRRVVESVHASSGRIFCQLWHCGRVGAKGILNGQRPLAPSDVNDDLDLLHVWALLANGRYVKISATASRSMSIAEIEDAVREYSRAAANAWSAGFDGVEVHAANGYLPHQFLASSTNKRVDKYGGSAENRARFLREVLVGISQAVPLNRVGVRLSPTAAYNNALDSDPAETYAYVARMLQELGVAFVEIADTNAWGGKADRDDLLKMIKPNFSGAIMLNGGLTPELAEEIILSGRIDLASFARSYIANPDLPERIAIHAPIREALPEAWYGGSSSGYTDFPRLSGQD